MRFTNGYIKLHRSAVFGDIGECGANCLALWVILLAYATRFETTIPWRGQPRVLPPGSVLIGLNEIAQKLKVSKKTVHKWLQYFQKKGSISIEGVTGQVKSGTIVTICNWKEYQDCPELGVTRREQEGNKEVTRWEQGVTLNGERKNKRNKEYIGTELELKKSSSSGAITVFLGNELIEEALKKVTHLTQHAWLGAYPEPDWIKQEILKAVAWEEVNPRKKSKNFGRFMSNWLSKGWEQHRKTIPSISANGKITDRKELFSFLYEDTSHD